MLALAIGYFMYPHVIVETIKTEHLKGSYDVKILCVLNRDSESRIDLTVLNTTVYKS